MGKSTGPATDANPLRSGPRMGKPPEPVTIVIFGASGDLTARKLVPALFSLACENRLPANYALVGYARRPWSHDAFRQEMLAGVSKFSRYKPDKDAMWDGFSKNLLYVNGNFDNPDDYTNLDKFLREQSDQRKMPDNRVYYLAAPPQSYTDIVTNLGQAAMGAESPNGWRRIVIEKPFGHNLDSAQALNVTLHQVFKENQVFRIDHYLGKETVQNIIVLRFANTIFEPIWNREFVDHVQISVGESVGVGSRAGYYDQAGVVRDIFQNHLLQLVTLTAMEPPVAFEADAIRDEKVKVLRAIHPIKGTDVKTHTVRAQYGAGVIEGERVPGYLEESDVPAYTQTATFAAIKWSIDSWRWGSVPFYTRSGKRMPTRATEISIHFKRPPHLLFKAMDDEELRANVLTIRIQPDEGISLRTEAKMPGQGLVRRSVAMDFRYGTSFGITDPPDAYERLLLDAMLGDATLFARSDEIEWAWTLIDPILEGWQTKQSPPLELYESGTWGPVGADVLIERDGRRWQRV